MTARRVDADEPEGSLQQELERFVSFPHDVVVAPPREEEAEGLESAAGLAAAQ